MWLLEDMRANGCQPNVHTYTAVMNVAIKRGVLQQALEVGTGVGCDVRLRY